MLLTATMLVQGRAMGAMSLVLEGHQGWREAGSATAELLLRAFGIAPGDLGRTEEGSGQGIVGAERRSVRRPRPRR
jgi:hypothetical protein